jgi:hypothetical protein
MDGLQDGRKGKLCSIPCGDKRIIIAFSKEFRPPLEPTPPPVISHKPYFYFIFQNEEDKGKNIPVPGRGGP